VLEFQTRLFRNFSEDCRGRSWYWRGRGLWLSREVEGRKTPRDKESQQKCEPLGHTAGPGILGYWFSSDQELLFAGRAEVSSAIEREVW